MSAGIPRTSLKVGGLITVQRRRNKIKTHEYLPAGRFPVVDQGQQDISGYIDDPERLYDGMLPVIVFGDHTCCLKWVDYPFAVGADGTQLLRAIDGMDTRYLFYALHTAELEQFGYQRHFKLLKECKICVPGTLEVQRQIADMLAAYDELVAINTRRIAILEEMARRLFEEWFVKFQFPGCTDPELSPEQWETSVIGDNLEALESGSRPKGGVGSDGDIPSIGAENVIGLGRYHYAKEKLISREFHAAMRRGHVRHGDVMLYKDGAYIGRLSMAWSGFPHEQCVVNEHVFLLRPKKSIPPQYLFFWLDRADLQAKIRGLNANAAQPGLNQPGVKGLPILIPPAPLLERFDAATKPIFDLLFTLARSNSRLRAARDLLLPKLVSGEINLAAMGQTLEAAA